MLGEILEKNAPDVTVQVVVKSNEDWGDYIDAVSTYPQLLVANMTVTTTVCSYRFVDPTASTTDHVPSSTH